MMKNEDLLFIEEFNRLSTIIHNLSSKNGFWNDECECIGEIELIRNLKNGLMISLMHSELSEALEAFRKGNPQDNKLPEFKNATVELADCIIRIMDFAKARNLRLGEAIIAKMEFNNSRPYKHGKEF